MINITPPEDSPYVDYDRLLHKCVRDAKPSWSGSCEDNFLLILEAHRRFHAETQDPRIAGLLTLAWASLEGGRA